MTKRNKAHVRRTLSARIHRSISTLRRCNAATRRRSREHARTCTATVVSNGTVRETSASHFYWCSLWTRQVQQQRCWNSVSTFSCFVDVFNSFLFVQNYSIGRPKHAAGRLRAKDRKIPCSAHSPIARLASKLVCERG